MKEYIIGPGEEGIRLDKQLFKILDNAGSGFIYKMLRKKNITLNDKKASGNEHLNRDDVIKIYLSDETFDKFTKATPRIEVLDASREIKDLIIYEDEGLIILNKPAGLLSQKAKAGDISINEMCLSYLVNKGELTDEKLKLFKPSVCNRLDRNTSGIIIFAKNHNMAAAVGNALSKRQIHKYYLSLVSGIVDKEDDVISYLSKDEGSNTVKIFDEAGDGRVKIHTAYRPLGNKDGVTLLEVDLITGKSHQIRAQMAALIHPLVGDLKYGDKSVNEIYKKKYGLKAQFLHAYKLSIPAGTEGPLSYLSGEVFIAPPSGIIKDIMDELFNPDIYKGK